jgi:hypothetical protein
MGFCHYWQLGQRELNFKACGITGFAVICHRCFRERYDNSRYFRVALGPHATARPKVFSVG